MPNTVRGFFRTFADAEQTKVEIASIKKIPTIDIQLYTQHGFHPPTRPDTDSSGLFERLRDSLGLSPPKEALCPEGVRRGGPVLDVKADERHIDAIADVLDRRGAEDSSVFTTR